MFRVTLAALAALAVAGPAFAQSAPPAPPVPPQPPGPFARADLDRDGVLTLAEVRQARAAAFDRMDANRDGVLTREEMRAGRAGMDGRRDHGAMRERRKGAGHGLAAIAGADANGDAVVTRAEWDAFVARVGAERQRADAQRMGDLFARLDADRDGRVTQAEREAARAAMRERTVDRRAGEGARPGPDGARSRLDADGDGRITRREWVERPDPLFERADANRDGRVTREEAAAAARGGAMRKGW